MEQEEFSALSNDKTIVIKLSDKEGAVAKCFKMPLSEHDNAKN